MAKVKVVRKVKKTVAKKSKVVDAPTKSAAPEGVNYFRILRKQVRAMFESEAGLTPEQRQAIEWQIMMNIGGTVYTVGKVHSNTAFVRVGKDAEPQSMYPDEMLELLTSWSQSNYVDFLICRDNEVFAQGFETVEQALAKTPLKFLKGVTISGLKSNGQKVDLYVLKKGLMDKCVWTKI